MKEFKKKKSIINIYKYYTIFYRNIYPLYKREKIDTDTKQTSQYDQDQKDKDEYNNIINIDGSSIVKCSNLTI